MRPGEGDPVAELGVASSVLTVPHQGTRSGSSSLFLFNHWSSEVWLLYISKVSQSFLNYWTLTTLPGLTYVMIFFVSVVFSSLPDWSELRTHHLFL